MPEPKSPRLCVLIDADNVPSDYAEAIFEEIAGLGEASVRRIFGDWSSGRLTKWKSKVAALGLVPDQQDSNTTGKNASDIGMVIAAMDFLHSGWFDGFVLVSSDSDFTRLASRVREQGLDVFGIGEKKTPEAFRMACKRFIYVENLRADSKTSAEKPAPEAPGTKSDQDVKTVRIRAPRPADALRKIVAAMNSIDPEGEWYGLGQIGQYITKTDPAFDPRTYGSSKLSDLIRQLPKEFEMKKGAGGHSTVRRIPGTA